MSNTETLSRLNKADLNEYIGYRERRKIETILKRLTKHVGFQACFTEVVTVERQILSDVLDTVLKVSWIKDGHRLMLTIHFFNTTTRPAGYEKISFVMEAKSMSDNIPWFLFLNYDFITNDHLKSAAKAFIYHSETWKPDEEIKPLLKVF